MNIEERRSRSADSAVTAKPSALAQGLLLVGCLFATSVTSAQTPERPRSPQTFALFELAPAGPAGASDIALSKLQHDPFEREFLYSRWVRPVLFDPRIAQRGDRVVFRVSEKEVLELELTTVKVVTDGAIWIGRFPGIPGSALTIIFARPKGVGGSVSLAKASVTILEQRRAIEVNTTPELAGWGLLREARPDTSKYADNADDTSDAAWKERVSREIELQRKADEARANHDNH